jgi:hypothetical protein
VDKAISVDVRLHSCRSFRNPGRVSSSALRFGHKAEEDGFDTVTGTQQTLDGAHMNTPAEGGAPPFLAFIDREIAAAKEEIAKLDQKVRVLIELRNNYLAQPDHADPTANEARQASSRQMLATESVITFLQQQDKPVATTQILAYLDSRGISFGGQQPRNALSVLLSRSALFKAHGRRGWTLARR